MLGEMQQDIQKLKKDMADVRATERSIAGALVRIEGKLDGLLDETTGAATKKQVGDLINNLVNKIDDFTGIVTASRDERKIADESFSGIQKTLQDHEARLIRLEPKKS